jgi:hypothetical protein
MRSPHGRRFVLRPGLLLGAALAASLLAGADSAKGQPSGQSATERAQKLLDEASAEMDAGKYASACPKLEIVVQLYPEGAGARAALGECNAKSGKLASAYRRYREAEDLALKAGNADRARSAAREADALKPRLSRLTLEVPEGMRNIRGLTITRNGSPVAAGEWGHAVPVDGGSHEIVVTAPGYSEYRKSVRVKAEGDDVHLPIPALESGSVPFATPEASAPAASAPPAATAAVQEGSSRSVAPAIALGGVGVAALAVGVALFVVSTDDYNKASSLSAALGDHVKSCPASPADECAELKKVAERSNAFYGPGLGLMIGGAVMAAAGGVYLGYVLGASPQAKTGTGPRVTAVGARGAGLFVQGSF